MMFQLPLSHNIFFKQLCLGVLTVKSTRHLTLYRVKDIHSNKDSVGCDAEVKVQYLCLLENNRFCGTGYSCGRTVGWWLTLPLQGTRILCLVLTTQT